MATGLDELIVDGSAGMTAEVAHAVKEHLGRYRVAVLRNTGMSVLAEMSDWATYLGFEKMPYRYGTGFRKPMGAGVLSVGTEPHFTNIEPHCEMAYWSYYPRHILFGCESIPRLGGDTVIGDNRRVTEAIQQTDTGRKIAERGLRYIRNLSDRERDADMPCLKSWQETFELDSWEELEQFCGEHDWTLVQRADGSVQVSYTEIGYEYDPVSGTNMLFTSMARLGRAFDNWPPFDSLPNELRPYHLDFADGSQFTEQDLDVMDAIFARHSTPIRWQPGDIAILENIAWTHARPPYELEDGDSRSIGVLVSDPVDRRRIVGDWDRRH